GTTSSKSVAATSTPPGSSRWASVFTRAGEASTPSARADVQMAASLAPRLPGVGREGEAGRLERAVVHAARNPAQRRTVGLGNTGLVPGVLQRTALERDVEHRRVAAVDARREHAAVVGDHRDEGVAEPREVGRAVPRELRADLPSARLDGAGQ